MRRLEGLEPRRGCGYRYIGKLYLIGTGISVPCHRLPLELPEACPTCGAEIKFHRGIQRLDFRRIFGSCEKCASLVARKEKPLCDEGCPVCFPPVKAWLMWVGTKFYPRTIDFINEARELGVSKAIAAIPKDFEVGKDWVFLAHKKAVAKTRENRNTLTGVEEYYVPGIFYAFVPQRVEMLIRESDATEEKISELEEKGIEPVIVPDDYEELVERAGGHHPGKRGRRRREQSKDSKMNENENGVQAMLEVM